ncbi:MAG: DUF2723 domain-containing protein [Magnetococcales bacterium]|nr:DUF2723 domain-containing protein [Magnetococcales bacterium]
MTNLKTIARSTGIKSKIDKLPERFVYETPNFNNYKFILLTLFLIIFSFYLLTSPRLVALEDDGEFLLSSYFLGISHPSGYPLYTIIAHFLMSFPWGSVAFKGHAISGLFGALTCLMVFWVALGLRLSTSGSVFAALMLATSKAFWSQSIITEVYTLNSLLFFIILHQVLILGFGKNVSSSDSLTDKKRVMALAFVYGLSLANHWPLMGMVTPGLLILLWPRWRLILKSISLALPISMLGLVPPYIWMVLRSQQNPLVSFSGPINGWDEFWFVFLRKHFFFQENHISANIWDIVTYGQGLAWELFIQFSPLGLILAVWGFKIAWVKLPRQINIGLATMFLSTPLIILLKLNVAYSHIGAHVISVTLLLSYAICALWIGMGVIALFEWLQQKKYATIKLKPLKMAVAIILICLPIALNYEKNFRQNYRWVDDYANFVFSLIEKDAIFFVSGDLHLFGLGYLHFIEGIRPDITLIPSDGLVFSTRLFKPDKLTRKERVKIIQNYIKNTDRAIYFIPSDLELVGKGYSSTNLGIIYRLKKDNKTGNTINIDEKLLDYLIKTKKSLNHTDFHTQEYVRYVVSNIIRSFVGVSSTISPEHQKNIVTRSLDMFGESLDVKTAALAGILDGRKGEDREMVEKILADCRQQLKENKDRTIISTFYLTQSNIYYRWNMVDKAISSMKMSLSVKPDVFNPALKQLFIMLNKEGRFEEASLLREDYIKRSKDQWDMLRSMRSGSLNNGGKSDIENIDINKRLMLDNN